MNDKALANSAVAIIVLNMSIGFANAIQLVGVAVMMRTVLLANQYNCDIGPSFSEKPWKSQEFDLFDRCRRTYSSSNSSTDRYSDEIVIESRNKLTHCRPLLHPTSLTTRALAFVASPLRITENE